MTRKKMKQSTMVLLLNGISVFALLFMIFSLFCYSNVNNKIDQANEDRFKLTYNANRFMNGSAYLTNEVRAYAATGDQSHYDNYWNEVNNLKNRDAGVANMKEIGITAEEQSMIDEMSQLSNTLVPLEEEAMNNAADGRKDLAIDYVYGDDYSNSVAKINGIKSSFLEKLDARAVAEVKRLMGVSVFIRVFLYISIAVVFVLQVLTSLLTRKRIIAPVLSVSRQMEEISEGNLSAEFDLKPDSSEIGMLVNSIHVTRRELKKYINDINEKLAQMAQGNMDLTIGNDYRGEFLPIQDAMRTILASLNRALSDINDATDQVSADSAQVATNAETLSEGATEQASSIDELFSQIKGLTDKLFQMTGNAEDARNCSLNASRQLQVSNEKMEELSSAINDISQSSSQIGGIIKTIEDIAFQTNILALNAAVEAARAGSAGKGFAVVADEVRNLAAKSSGAAKDTTALIENTLHLIEKGTSLTSDTTEALLSVVSGAKQSTDLVDEIAAVAEEQTQALNDVRSGIEQISNVVQTNAASAEESAASAQKLNDLANILRQSVHRFRLRG